MADAHCVLPLGKVLLSCIPEPHCRLLPLGLPPSGLAPDEMSVILGYSISTSLVPQSCSWGATQAQRSFDVCGKHRAI